MARAKAKPTGESVEELEARIAAMKDAQGQKKKRGRPKGSKNKVKVKVKELELPGQAAAADDVETAAPPVKKPRGRHAAKANGIPEVPWKSEPELTEGLLSNIEDNGPCRVAFGFTKGDLDDAGVTTALTQAQHSERIAQKLLVQHESGRWAEVPASALASTIGNRITTLKTDYAMHKANLGETGFGVVTEGRAAELYGAPQNAWEQINAEFPWFYRMHALLVGSPVHDTEACSNSQDSLDGKLSAFSSQFTQESFDLLLSDATSNGIDGTEHDGNRSDYDGADSAQPDEEEDELNEDELDLTSSRAPSPSLPSVAALVSAAAAPEKAKGKGKKNGKAVDVTDGPQPSAPKPTTAAKAATAAATTAPAPPIAAAPKRKQDAMLGALTTAISEDHKNKAALLESSHRAKRQRQEAEQRFQAKEAQKARDFELKKLALQLQIAQAQAGAGGVAQTAGGVPQQMHAGTGTVFANEAAQGGSQLSFTSGASGSSFSRSSTPYDIPMTYTPPDGPVDYSQYTLDN